MPSRTPFSLALDNLDLDNPFFKVNTNTPTKSSTISAVISRPPNMDAPSPSAAATTPLTKSSTPQSVLGGSSAPSNPVNNAPSVPSMVNQNKKQSPGSFEAIPENLPDNPASTGQNNSGAASPTPLAAPDAGQSSDTFKTLLDQYLSKLTQSQTTSDPFQDDYSAKIKELASEDPNQATQVDVDAANKATDLKYDQQLAETEQKLKDQQAEEFSNLAGVGFNPLSSGGTALDAKYKGLLDKFTANINAARMAEKAQNASGIKNDFRSSLAQTLKNLQDERTFAYQKNQDDMKNRQGELTQTLNSIYQVMQIQKAKRDLSSSEKDDQYKRVMDILGSKGSAAFTGMSDSDLRAMEKSAGLPSGFLDPNSKTLKELEAQAQKDKLVEVSSGASLFDPKTGKLVATAPSSFDQRSLSGLNPTQLGLLQNAQQNIRQDPDIKEFVGIRDSFDRMQASAADPSPAGDMAMIFNYMKILDPGSTVREGEFANAANAGGLDDKIVNTYNNILYGQRLTASQRADFLNRAKGLYQPKYNKYQDAMNFYGNQLDTFGIPRDLVLRDYGSGYKPAGGSTPSDSDIRSAYDKLQPDIPYDQAVQKYGVDGVQKIIQTHGGTFSQPLSKGVNGSQMRTDRHNNPTAFTTDIARIGGLKEGTDYTVGDPFSNGKYHTARLTGSTDDAINKTIQVIDRIGFYTGDGRQRWTHTAIPKAQWDSLSLSQKKAVVVQMYQHEGGSGIWA